MKIQELLDEVALTFRGKTPKQIIKDKDFKTFAEWLKMANWGHELWRGEKGKQGKKGSNVYATGTNDFETLRMIADGLGPKAVKMYDEEEMKYWMP